MKTTTTDHVKALRASAETYHRDGDYEAFTARQQRIWDAIERDGCQREVLSALRSER